MNLRKEAFIPRKDLWSLNFMSSKKVNSLVVSSLESLKWLRRLQSGHFSFVLMASPSHSWTWHLSTFHSNSWVFILSSSWSNFMSHLTPLSQFKECIVFAICLVSASLSQHCQVTYRVIQCSKGIIYHNIPLQLLYLPSSRSYMIQSYDCSILKNYF